MWSRYQILNVKEEEEYIVSDGLKQIPIKWTAQKLNYGSTPIIDVKFGVLAWEISHTRGEIPTRMTNTRARSLDLGTGCQHQEHPDEVYQSMLRCIANRQEDRLLC